jgi:multiple sugar transport system ATP-binding protein
MSVHDNMAFGLKLRKTPKAEIEKRVHEAARILDIEHLLDRKPKALSGGQRQRVAMGRAIVREPKVFLMDEPLSNLDAKLRVQMRIEITKLHQKLQTTFIYVTHDQVEAMTLGTRIVVMKDGVAQQVDSPVNLYNKPKNLFVAGFMGSPQMNLVDVTVDIRGSDVYLMFGDHPIKLPEAKARAIIEGRNIDGESYHDKTVVMGIRPEDIKDEEVFISQFPEAIIKADVEVTELLGAEVNMYIICAGQELTAIVNPRSTAKSGDTITMALDVQRIHVFDKETEQTITN